MIQKTLVLIKPDGVQRGLIGEILKRFEQRGLKILAMKMVKTNKGKAEQHYREEIEEKHGKHVRTALIDFITNAPIIVICISGSSAISIVRKIVGNTYPGEAGIGTIRGDLAHASKEYAKKSSKALPNLVHASENEEEAKREIELWFSPNELYDYQLSHESHIL